MAADLQRSLEQLDAVELKQNADAAVKMGRYQEGLDLYAQARAVNGSNPALWSNAALCHLGLQDHRGCVEACSAALALLDQGGEKTGPARAKALLRRGASRLELKELQGALEDPLPLALTAAA